MKRIVIVSSVFALLFLRITPLGFSMNMNNVAINGEINAITKIQDSYMTPLDASSARAGANDRNDQNFRGFGNLVFSYGMPGSSEWFSAAKIAFDANDPDKPDNNDLTEAAENPGYKTNKNNYSDDHFQMEYAFVMFRPFEVQGGRPFGIMAGMIPIKATANAAYFNFFKADPEEDFAFYTLTALTEVPGIGIDFHVSEGTGIGVSFARGVKDASEIGTLMMSDSAENWILWAELNEYNIGFNIAYQHVKGEGYASDQWTTPAGNILYEYNQPFEHIVLNSMLTYTFGAVGFKFMPAAGYQLIKGEECLAVPGYDPRDVEIALFSYGLKIGMNFFNVPGEVAVLYTEVPEREKIDGVKSIPKGTIASTLGFSGAPDIPEEGQGSGVLALLEFSSSLHAEYAFKLNPFTEVGLFYYQLDTVEDQTKSAPYIKNQLQPSLGGTPLESQIDAIADSVAGQLKRVEWTDSTSYGLFLRMVF